MYFNDKHSYKDFKLVLTSKDIPLPEPKLHYIEVPCADGQLDLSTALTDGDVKYKNREISMTFAILGSNTEREQTKSRIASFLHGKVMNVKFDVDRNFYYKGRCIIDSFKESTGVSELTIKVDADPYKYNVQKSVYTSKVTTSQVVTIPNQTMKVVPLINVSAEMQLEYKTKTYKLYAGDNVLTDVYLGVGANNVLKFIGNGTVKVEFRGGEL